jgi:hypothetical protein
MSETMPETARELVIQAFQRALPQDADYLARLLTEWLGTHQPVVVLSHNEPIGYTIRVLSQADADTIVDNFGGTSFASDPGFSVSGFVVDLTS